MNTKDNKRHQETLRRIYTTFGALLREQELNKISVTELCEIANIERSTFYANFEDIPALANAFFRNGIYSVAKLWFEAGCTESPQKMGEITQREPTKLL